MWNALLILLVAVVATECGPLHASCKIDWNFGVPCSQVKKSIVDQIDKWKGSDCGSGEKCRYKLVSETDTKVKATHTTPVREYVDDLTFTFSPDSNACKVHGYSTSETWYAVLDASTNYCNLHNLIDGSGLIDVRGYRETTSDGVCTQYSKRNCQKY